MTSPFVAPSIRGTEPLYHVKLLAALRSGDPALIHPFLTEIGKGRRQSVEGDVDVGAAALHLAIRCASADTVALLLSHRAISPNGVHPQGSGTTPLHLAASLGRTDVVNLLLEQDRVDDTLRDSQGNTCVEVAKGKEVVRAIEDSRSFLNASYRSLLRTYIHSPADAPPSTVLLALLESPRVRFVDLSYLDDASGTSLLHEAARRKDLRLIELAARAGADIFVRDRRGKMSYDGLPKDDRVRVFLRQFANHDTSLIDEPLSEPPTLKGYLNKYANVAKGYNARWFVLKNGILSYYRHQDDETITSRGSISMKTAVLKVPSTPASGSVRLPSTSRGASAGESLRFEVHSRPAGQGAVEKWYMKANHPVEAARWTQAIARSIAWHRREGALPSPTERALGGDKTSDKQRKSGESDASALRPASLRRTLTSGTSASSTGAGSPSGGGSGTRRQRTGTSISSLGDAASIASPASILGAESVRSASPVGSSHLAPPVQTDDEDRRGEHDDDDDEADEGDLPPHEASFALQGEAASAQLELTAQLISSFPVPGSNEQAAQMRAAFVASFTQAQSAVDEYVRMASSRDTWWRTHLMRERARQGVWEESLRTVVKEGETLERELRARSRRRGSRLFMGGTASSVGSTVKGRSRLSVQGAPRVDEVGYFVTGNEVVLPPTGTGATATTPTTAKQLQTPSQLTPTPQHAPSTEYSRTMANTEEDLDDEEDDDEDEFFDAIESGTLPNLVVDASLSKAPLSTSSPTSSSSSAYAAKLKRDTRSTVLALLPRGADPDAYAGYTSLRAQLDIRSDDRPSTSLWSVLKHSIGKDLTRISFPVFFNEPTSMLQRMAEDMEFSECLDIAAREPDPLRRIAFVGAFAMSNYSSTIGRIAKPFNPMLGETFEYVRLDKGYRYVSEQVSHHPPISACWAESALWHYYGEVDAQNKFMGKSFEIRPTGVAHADLLIPASRGPGYPALSGREVEVAGPDKVVEHYSWKKVTTNVSGFILGSPTIDHYGEMVVTNHRTGDTCILTFKPRGWRGRDAYEIAGCVQDANGHVAYEIAGRWNSQLIARAAGSGSGFLHPDASVSSLGTTSTATGSMDSLETKTETPTSPGGREYVLLWRNSEKPPAPFNLTPFAITLNDCPQNTLRSRVCPTDCRLRPDQRAFELGRYGLANGLKNDQEEKQRSTRRAREEGRRAGHRPRWFSAVTDECGERLWAPVRDEDGGLEYWSERERAWKNGRKWKDVEDIFIETPEELKSALA